MEDIDVLVPDYVAECAVVGRKWDEIVVLAGRGISVGKTATNSSMRLKPTAIQIEAAFCIQRRGRTEGAD